MVLSEKSLSFEIFLKLLTAYKYLVEEGRGGGEELYKSLFIAVGLNVAILHGKWFEPRVSVTCLV